MPLTSLPNEILIKILESCYPPGTFSAIPITKNPQYWKSLAHVPWFETIAGDVAMRNCSTTCWKLHAATQIIFQGHERVIGDSIKNWTALDELRHGHMLFAQIGAFSVCSLRE